jgi:hypothetical protein
MCRMTAMLLACHWFGKTSATILAPSSAPT